MGRIRLLVTKDWVTRVTRGKQESRDKAAIAKGYWPGDILHMLTLHHCSDSCSARSRHAFLPLLG